MSKELHLTQEQDFEKFRHAYRAAIKEVRIKIEILSEDFAVRHDYNPIHHMERRLKATESIEEKLHRLGKEVSIKSARENIHDIAGIRVVCNFIDDVYTVADMLLGQNDVRLIEKKDSIVNPKETGYRSLHLILEVPVFFMNEKKPMKVEVQMRTIAMDFWASIEHKLYYKKQTHGFQDSVSEVLGICAEQLHTIDMKMQEISERIYHQER